MSKNKTVLFLIDELSEYGGSELQLLELVTYLRDTSLKPVVAVCGRDDLKGLFKERGIPFYNLNIKSIWGIEGVKGIHKIVGLIKKIDAKLLVTYHTQADILGPMASTIASIPNISSRRDMGFTKKKHHIEIQKRLNPLVNKIIAVSKAVARVVSESEEVGMEKIWVIYNGVDTKRFVPVKDREEVRRELNISKDDILIGTIANFSPVKGQNYLIEAAKTIIPNYPNLKVILVGDGPTKKECEKLSAQFLNKSIIFTGVRHDPDRILGALDIFVMPSLHEGLSNAILQAMASGLPVVASDGGSNPEIIEDGTDGFIFKAQDHISLREKLELLLKAPKLRTEMGYNARKKVVEKFQFEQMCVNYMTAFNSVIEEGILHRKITKRFLKRVVAETTEKGWKIYSFMKKTIKPIPIILGYHRVLPQLDYYDPELVTTTKIFEEQLEVIKEYWEVWDLEELSEAIIRGERPHAVAITFDDGYEDNFQFALKVLRKFRVPSTIFVTTSVISNRDILWHDLLALVVEQYINDEALISTLKQIDSLKELNEAIEKKEVYPRIAAQKIVEKALALSLVERNILVQELKVKFKVNPPKYLTEEMIKELDQNGVKVGSHTVSHDILPQLPLQDMIEEVVKSKEQLESIVGYPINSIAYPCGKYNEMVLKVVKESGYKFGFTTERGFTGDRYRMPRVMVSELTSRSLFSRFSKELFVAELTGVIEKLREKFHY